MINKFVTMVSESTPFSQVLKKFFRHNYCFCHKLYCVGLFTTGVLQAFLLFQPMLIFAGISVLNIIKVPWNPMWQRLGPIAIKTFGRIIYLYKANMGHWHMLIFIKMEMFLKQ